MNRQIFFKKVTFCEILNLDKYVKKCVEIIVMQLKTFWEQNKKLDESKDIFKKMTFLKFG